MLITISRFFLMLIKVVKNSASNLSWCVENITSSLGMHDCELKPNPELTI